MQEKFIIITLIIFITIIFSKNVCEGFSNAVWFNVSPNTLPIMELKWSTIDQLRHDRHSTGSPRNYEKGIESPKGNEIYIDNYGGTVEDRWVVHHYGSDELDIWTKRSSGGGRHHGGGGRHHADGSDDGETVNCCGGGGACGFFHCPALGAGQEGCIQPWAMPAGMDFDTDCKVGGRHHGGGGSHRGGGGRHHGGVPLCLTRAARDDRDCPGGLNFYECNNNDCRCKPGCVGVCAHDKKTAQEKCLKSPTAQ